MLYERTRSLRWMGESLGEVARDETVPEEIWQRATQILACYPSAREIEEEAKRCARSRLLLDDWLAPEVRTHHEDGHDLQGCTTAAIDINPARRHLGDVAAR